MRLSVHLLHVAALLAIPALPACSSASTDASCGGSSNPSATRTISGAQACAIYRDTGGMTDTYSFDPTCVDVCGAGFNACMLPNSYIDAPPAPISDGGADASDSDGALPCPAGFKKVDVVCSQVCTGRLTESFEAPAGPPPQDWGERFAAMAYLEAVAVTAFERLERELEAHGAPAALRRDARRARRDEVRHTAMTVRMARRWGRTARLPRSTGELLPARSLLHVALENAVEGCVRETYGAVQGMVQALRVDDRAVRRTMALLASDECRHAELAWAVHRWAMPRLSPAEREQVTLAMREAVHAIAEVDPRASAMLFDALLGGAPAHGPPGAAPASSTAFHTPAATSRSS